MKTVYIAGKITGDPFYWSKFRAAQFELEKAGYIVLSPAVLPGSGFEYDAYIRMTQAMMDECEAVCFLPDWVDSYGAMYEYGRAASKGKEVILYADWLNRSKENEGVEG